MTAVLAGTLSLNACGFQPLYGQSLAGPQVQPHLASIFVQPIPDRIGQVLRTKLSRTLSPKTRTTAPAYELRITLTESLSTLAVERDASATRANLTLTSSFTLVRRADSLTLYSGAVNSIASYNILTSQFATKIAKDDARARAVQDLSVIIRTRLAIYFQAKGQTQPPLRTTNRTSVAQ